MRLGKVFYPLLLMLSIVASDFAYAPNEALGKAMNSMKPGNVWATGGYLDNQYFRDTATIHWGVALSQRIEIKSRLSRRLPCYKLSVVLNMNVMSLCLQIKGKIL